MSNKPQTSRTLAELHTHSIASDGQYAPEVVAGRCAELGVKVWSLTDHDTLDGCLEAATAAKSHDITFIPGVEVSAREGVSIHVLGYGLDPENDELASFFAERKELRETRMERMILATRAAGYDVSIEEVAKIAKGGAMARPHLARALVQKGVMQSVQEVFDELLAEGKPGYVASPYMSVPEAIDLIHQFGGVAILAHPAHYGNDAEIPKWIQRDALDGIEVQHPRHGTSDVERYTKIADSFGVLKTASSDFHGEAVAPERELGVTHVPDDWLDALRERLAI
jgi:predicted metal-dependent phosphoesterase TrpH